MFLSRPKFEKYVSFEKRFQFLTDFINNSVFIAHQEIVDIVTDPKDNMILELARAGKANFIISGDQHLLKLYEFEGIPIITAKKFLTKVKI